MHEYPGLGLDLHNGNGNYPIGAPHDDYNSRSELVYVRELAMMDIMDKLTDKPDWHNKVFDESIVSRWRNEALAFPDQDLYNLAISGKFQFWNHKNEVTLMNDKVDMVPREILNDRAFDCCIQELRSKAEYFKKTAIIPTMEACASIAKSDTLVPQGLHGALRSAFDTLKADQQSSPHWHPNSNEMVQYLVDPYMYPLVYGRSRVFKEECVGVKDAITTWAGKGSVIPEEENTFNAEENQWSHSIENGTIPPEYWSRTYQWLPANVAFQPNGGVKITSYVNNLHPGQYPNIYRTIERLIERCLPLWDQCLQNRETKEGAGRMEPRMGLPDDADDDCETNWIPDNFEDCAEMEVAEDELYDEGYDPHDADHDINFYKWKVLREPRHPEPSPEEVDYMPKQGQRLIDLYQESGLQIIVKMASIELTPEKPNFPVGSWHVEGQMNEHICGTALYYLDSDNITDSSLSFRMQTDTDMGDPCSDYAVAEGSYTWMESVFGTNLSCRISPCLQNYGSVQTREGRLLAFPNVFQNRVSPFELVDPTKPGHCRFITLWLVDPTVRIISTANVPPQQMSWYIEALLGTTPEARKEALSKLPAELMALLQEKDLGAKSGTAESVVGGNAKLPEELMDMVREWFVREPADVPMGIEEAWQHRVELMEERKAFVQEAENGWQSEAYDFDKH